MLVFLVRLQMQRQMTDAAAQKSDLHLWRTRIRIMPAVISDQLGLILPVHSFTLLSSPISKRSKLSYFQQVVKHFMRSCRYFLPFDEIR